MHIIGKPTDNDMETYPHVLLTSPHQWDPSVLNYTHRLANTSWASSSDLRDQHDPRIDACGNYMDRHIQTLSIISGLPIHTIYKHVTKSDPVDFEALKPFFGWINVKTIKNTFERTTQWATVSTRYPI